MPLSHIRAGRLYRFQRSFTDYMMPQHYRCKDGDTVRVKNLYGCPRAGTMGQCHIVDPNTDALLGMVSCNSLAPLPAKGRKSAGRV